ncbi:MAG: hypothetical protein AAF830_15615 [Pseudomonadota bacterium]
MIFCLIANRAAAGGVIAGWPRRGTSIPPYYTTMSGAAAAARAIAALTAGNLEVKPLQDYFAA